MPFIVVEEGGPAARRAFPIVGPFDTRKEAESEAAKQDARHGGKILVKPVKEKSSSKSGAQRRKKRGAKSSDRKSA